MRVGIDINPILDKSIGKGMYLKNMLYALAQIDKKNEYFLYGYENPSLSLPENFRFIRVSGKPGKKWDLKVVTRSKVKDKVSMFYTTESLYSAIIHPKPVLHIHDLGVVRFPKMYPQKLVSFTKRYLPLATKRAKKIITPSSVTKSHLVELYKVPKTKITKISGGVPNWTQKDISQNVTDSILDKYSVPENYFLFVGTIEPRKNLFRLIEAFERFKEKDRKEYKLLVIGKKGDSFEKISKKVIDCKLTQDVLFLGYVPENDLKSIFTNATAVIIPSILEGFGLTALEAMACNVPVISSRKGAVGETVGEASLEINPRNVDSIINALREIKMNNSLREELTRKGAKRIEKFSWTKSAKKLKAAFEEAAE